ncbi:serine/threonine protein phosphatase, partial [Streptomyces sp. SID8380]|nr:serine/threonine protein phosphatase [Streptomyces sp. SID8380]
DPLPVGDERPTGPLVLRLRRTDRIPDPGMLTGQYTPSGALLPATPLPDGSVRGAQTCEVEPGGALAEVLRGVRPLF